MENYIKENYGKIKAKDIALELNIPTWKVYKLANKLGVKTNKICNKQFYIDKDMEQIIISGLFGDGNIRLIGSGAIYREKHALDEEEYCIWKYKMLKDMTSMNKLYYYKDKYVNFDTSNSKQLVYYKNMSIHDRINKLDDLGLLLYFLDDGWTQKRKGYYSGNISSVKIPIEYMQMLAEKYSDLCECKVNVSIWSERDGKNPIVLYIPNITKLLEITKKYGINKLDIYNKKFNK